MTDAEMTAYLGIGHLPLVVQVKLITGRKRATWERMAEIETELGPNDAGLGPRPRGVLLDYDRPPRRRRPFR